MFVSSKVEKKRGCRVAQAERKRIGTKEKQEIMAAGSCYVCSDLKLDHAGFAPVGYESREVHSDHLFPFGNVGTGSGEVLPIHAATGGSTPEDSDFETSTRRNCHRIKRNNFTSRSSFVQFVKATLEARNARYVDDVYENRPRKPSAQKFKLSVDWDDSNATFRGRSYPVLAEEKQGTTWRRFLAPLEPQLIFTDSTSQVRPANSANLQKMVRTFLEDGFPMFSPINARIDKCGHVVIFDGNHRATAHALAYGVSQPMPVMIWDIASGSECAVGPPRDSGKDERTLG